MTFQAGCSDDGIDVERDVLHMAGLVGTLVPCELAGEIGAAIRHDAQHLTADYFNKVEATIKLESKADVRFEATGEKTAMVSHLMKAKTKKLNDAATESLKVVLHTSPGAPAVIDVEVTAVKVNGTTMRIELPRLRFQFSAG